MQPERSLPEINWRYSDKYPRIDKQPLGKTPSSKPVMFEPVDLGKPPIIDSFPQLAQLRESLASEENERNEIFAHATELSLTGFSLPDFYSELITKHPHLYSLFLSTYFALQTE